MKMRLHGCKVAVAGNKIENKGGIFLRRSGLYTPVQSFHHVLQRDQPFSEQFRQVIVDERFCVHHCSTLFSQTVYQFGYVFDQCRIYNMQVNHAVIMYDTVS